MTEVWPWLAVAGLGALHGLNPANGWALVATGGGAGRRGLLHGLAPIGLGHLASAALVAAAVAQGATPQQTRNGALAGVLLGAVLLAAHACRRHTAFPLAGPLAFLGAFAMASLHGAGLMLVPAFVPLCLSAGPARELGAAGSLPLALGALGVHLAALLATAGVLAAGVRRCRSTATTKWFPWKL